MQLTFNFITCLAAVLLAFHWLTVERIIPIVGRLGCVMVIVGLILSLPSDNPGIICIRVGLCLWLAARLWQVKAH